MRIYYRPQRTAFTLLELMIAVTLGMIIVYTAMAGFRVASQTMSLANRLSLENSIIRSGFTIAHEHLDFWTNIDDPTDPSRQALRKKVAVGGNVASRLSELNLPGNAGLPFAPFSGPDGVFTADKPPFVGMPKGTSTLPRFQSNLGTAQAPIYLTEGNSYPLVHELDDDIGFDPTFAWAPHDPRTWFRGNCVEKKIEQKLYTGKTYDPNKPEIPVMPKAPAQLMGRYSIFTNFAESSSMVFSNRNIWKDSLSSTPYQPTYQASLTPPHRWYPRQLLGLIQALGYYGVCDYMPSNAIYNMYFPYVNNKTSLGGMPNFFAVDNNPASCKFLGTGMINIHSLGLYSLTVTNSYGIINPYTNNLSADQIATEHYKYFSSDYSAYAGGGAASLQDFMRKTTGFDNPMPVKPEHWPSVEIGVARY